MLYDDLKGVSCSHYIIGLKPGQIGKWGFCGDFLTQAYEDSF